MMVQEHCDDTEIHFCNLPQQPGDCPVDGSVTLEQNNFSDVYPDLSRGALITTQLSHPQQVALLSCLSSKDCRVFLKVMEK